MRQDGVIVRHRIGLPPVPKGREEEARDGLPSPGLASVLDLVHRVRRFDPSGYCLPILARRVEDRIAATGAGGYGDYLRLVEASRG